MLVGDDMENWMANRMDDVDNLHVEIDNLNDPLMEFCFIRDIDRCIYQWHLQFNYSKA
jgi:hypothetical protein